MADSALYYPYIDVPADPSLNAVLLYWDRLGAIVPEGARTSRLTQQLITEGLVAPIRPRNYLWRQLKEFVRGYEEILDDLPPGEPSAPVFIHVDKGTSELWQLLARRGLAATEPGGLQAWEKRSGWISVEGRAGALYLAYLASWLAAQPEINMKPITDQRRLFAAMGGSIARNAALFDNARGALLEDMLPSPSTPVPPSDLSAFKEDHRSLLQGFRRRVEALVLDCAQEPDPDLRARRLRAGRIELVEGADEVRRRLAERRWPTRAGTFCAFLSALPGVAGGVVTGEPALVATAGTVPLLIDFVRSRFPDRQLDPPVATYAILAQQRFS